LTYSSTSRTCPRPSSSWTASCCFRG
jgi:hypothetical protein